MESTSVLRDLVATFLSDSDPSRFVIQLEVRSLLSFTATMIDALLGSELSFGQFRPILDSRIALIRGAGHTELAQAFIGDFDRLETQLQSLRELEAAGPSSYIAAHVEDLMTAWRERRAFIGLQIQVRRDQTRDLEVAAAEASSSTSHLHSRVAESRAKIVRLEQEIQAEKESLSVLELEAANKEEASHALFGKLSLSRQSLSELEEEAARTLGADEESVRTGLQGELQQSFIDDVSDLRDQIRCHKLDI